MNDIERQIEEDFVDENKEIEEGDNTIKNKFIFNKNNDNKRKKIIYLIICAFLVVIFAIFIYLIVLKKDDNNNKVNNKTSVDNNITENMDNNLVKDNTAYVTCDDNTALLNVRNSPTGDIIDGLSCYKEIIIEEELEGTDNCSKWYKINYKKRGSNYTGYSCATYIKKNEINNDIKNLVVELIDKANNYYENNFLKSYCGPNILDEKKEITFDEDGVQMTGIYIKSEYKSLEELKTYLLSFMDEALFTSKLKLSDFNNPKYYDDYYEIDGNLYCRNYSGKGWMTYYTGNYDYEVVRFTDSNIDVNIAYEYLDKEIIDDKCNLTNLSSCTNSKFNYELGKATIKNIDGNYIITDINFHK